METPNGLLIVDKPAGFTSHDVVAKLRGVLGTRRIGHGGTLDPMATGVLVVLVGPATRAAEYAAAQRKEYIAALRFGQESDTQDSTGRVLSTGPDTVTRADYDRSVTALTGEILQLPPMYSALKVGGKKLVDLARQGQQVERQPRPVTIHEIETLFFDGHEARLRIVCSKGTYVRTLCHDLGHLAGTCAVMTALRRTRSGAFTLQQAQTLDAIETRAARGDKPDLLPVDGLFAHLPAAEVDEDGWRRAQNGAFIAPAHLSAPLPPEGELMRVYHQGQFRFLGRSGRLDKGGRALFVHKNF